MLHFVLADFRPFTTPISVWRVRRQFAQVDALFQSVVAALTDPYRPEQHYMRGPGPKWRAKHARGESSQRPPE